MTRSTARRRTSFLPATPVGSLAGTSAGTVVLGRTPWWVLLVLVALAAVGTFALDATSVWTLATFLDLLAVIACAGFAWRGWLAASLLLGIGVAAGLTGTGLPHAVLLAIVYGLVVYTCPRALAVAYGVVVAILLLTAVFQGRTGIGGALVLLALGGASAALGWWGRRAAVHRARLEDDVARRAREADDAVERERQRIADELHDIVAHDITIVAMHARALSLAKDAQTHEASVRAISDSATQSLTNIRRLLRMSSHSTVPIDEPQPRSLLDIVVEIQARLRTAEIPLECTFEPDDAEPPVISLNVATTLAQVARESANNVIVHAPRSRHARLVTTITPETVGFSLWNDVPPRASAKSAGGYGLVRMRERVRLMGGAFSSGPQSDGWLTMVSIPRD